MPESLLVQLPNGKQWEMPSYIAKQLYDFIEVGQQKKLNLEAYDFEQKWLKKLPEEDQLKVKKE